MSGLYVLGGIVAVGLLIYLVIALAETGGLLMTANGILQFVVFFGVLLVIVKPLGVYMARVYEGKPTWLTRLLGPIERLINSLAGIRPEEEMGWKTYTISLLMFNMAGMLLLYGLQRLQGWLPLNPAGVWRRGPGPFIQYGGEFHDEYQLAGLRRAKPR